MADPRKKRQARLHKKQMESKARREVALKSSHPSGSLMSILALIFFRSIKWSE